MGLQVHLEAWSPGECIPVLRQQGHCTGESEQPDSGHWKTANSFADKNSETSGKQTTHESKSHPKNLE